MVRSRRRGLIPSFRKTSRRWYSIAELQYGLSIRGKSTARRFGLLIAATAARHQAPLLTRNAADFAGLESVVTVVPVR